MLFFNSNNQKYKTIEENLLFSNNPSDYFKELKKSNKISEFIQLHSLIGSIQDTKWHPEGDVWTHTLLVLDAAVEFRKLYIDEKSALIFMLGCLCHDFGKPFTMVYENGRIKNPAHDIKGVFPTQLFLKKLGYNFEIIDKVSALVKEHLRPMQLYLEKDKISNQTIKNLQKRVNIIDLINVAKADHNGRLIDDKTNIFPHCDWLQNKIEEINNQNIKVQTIIKGDDLIQLAIKPGIKFGKLLSKANELYNIGIIKNKIEAINWVKENI